MHGLPSNLDQNVLQNWQKNHWRCFQNASRMAPSGSRRPLQSSLGSGTLPRPNSTAKPRPFWIQNWTQNRPRSVPKSIWKATSKQTRFRDRFGTNFRSIFEPLEANFWSKLKAFTCKVNVTLDKTELFRNYVKTQYFWKKIGYHRWLKHVRTRRK